MEQDNEESNAQTEYVDGGGPKLGPSAVAEAITLEHLRRRVVDCRAPFALRNMRWLGRSQVDEVQAEGVGEHDVVGLYVKVSHTLVMHRENALDNLERKVLLCRFRED